MTNRDCIHGHQARTCEVCDLQRRLEVAVEGLKTIRNTGHPYAAAIAAETLRKVEGE